MNQIPPAEEDRFQFRMHFFHIDATTAIAAISQEPEFEGMDNLHEGKDWIKVDDRGSYPS